MRNKDIPLTHLQRQMLLGSLLGDAHINVNYKSPEQL